MNFGYCSTVEDKLMDKHSSQEASYASRWQMSNTIPKFIFIVLIACSISGCCTMKKTSEINQAIQENNKDLLCDTKKYIDTTINYPGTYFNVNKLILLPYTCHGEGCWAGLFYPIILIGAIVDLPLDIVADTLFLPYTMPLSLTLDCEKGKI